MVLVFFGSCAVCCGCVLWGKYEGRVEKKKVLGRWSLLGLELTNPHERFSTEKLPLRRWFFNEFLNKKCETYRTLAKITY